MDLDVILQIIALVVTALIGVGGTAFSAKYKAMKSVIQTIGDALEDDKLTKEEIQTIYKQIKKLF